MVSGPMEPVKEIITQDDLDQARERNPAWEIHPQFAYFEGRKGDTVLRRTTLSGLEAAMRLSDSGEL